MTEAIKVSVVWVSICAFLSIAVVACGNYNSDLAKYDHEEWLVKQQMCEKRGGLMEKSWGADTCEERK